MKLQPRILFVFMLSLATPSMPHTQTTLITSAQLSAMATIQRVKRLFAKQARNIKSHVDYPTLAAGVASLVILTTTWYVASKKRASFNHDPEDTGSAYSGGENSSDSEGSEFSDDDMNQTMRKIPSQEISSGEKQKRRNSTGGIKPIKLSDTQKKQLFDRLNNRKAAQHLPQYQLAQAPKKEEAHSPADKLFKEALDDIVLIDPEIRAFLKQQSDLLRQQVQELAAQSPHNVVALKGDLTPDNSYDSNSDSEFDDAPEASDEDLKRAEQI